MTTSTHVELRGATKRFGATTALSGVDVSIARGSIHALVGENGAGKSTLGKVIAGLHRVDEGEMLLAGRAVSYRSPRQALQDRLTMVAQELSLVDRRSVVENVFLGQEDHYGPFVRSRALRLRYDELVDRAGIALDPAATVGELSVAQQQKVEILRALARDAELIVMDEPTARLASGEARQLADTMRALAARGTTIVLVSHFLDEVLEVSDAVTVLRDGVVVRTGPAADETHAGLIEAMIGRPLAATFPPRPDPATPREPLLEVRGLGLRGAFENVSFDVRAGEVVVLAGLVGAGRSEVARAVFGAEQADTGTVTLSGRPVRAKHPAAAILAGIAMIPESRKTQGLFLLRPVRENVTLPYLASLTRFGAIGRRREAEVARAASANAGLVGASLGAPVSALSGGNQQKVLFARSVVRTPRLLIADEPTRGVDVGAKRAIYDLMAQLSEEGMGILVISSELEEVIGLAHRVLVMRGGSVVAELKADGITDENVMHAAFGTTRGEP